MDIKRVLICIRFDGSMFCGWQVQANARSVQQTMQDAVETVFGKRYGISGCGRTDSGVHALHYYCHMDIPSAFPTERISSALNLFFHAKRLPVAVLSVREVAPDFHSRYFIRSKEYMYVIQNNRFHDPFYAGKAMFYHKKLNIDRMKAAAVYFAGRHNFSSFMADPSDIPKAEAVRTMNFVRVTAEKGFSDIVRINLSASGFLNKMVRIIVGTLIEVSEGKKEPEDIPKIIAAQDRRTAGRTVTAEGLYLYNVDYFDNVLY